MPMNLTLTVTPPYPQPGQAVTATYAVTGEPATITIQGTAIVDGVTLNAATTITNVEKFNPPTAPGMTFIQSTTDVHVFTAAAPPAS